MDVSSRVAELVSPAIADAGLVLDSVVVKAAGKRSRVLVTVDLPEDAIGSADMDAVAAASRGINKALDEADIELEAYVLEVSTPGTDRPLSERKHFMRARTRLVVLSLHDGAELTGRLLDLDGDNLVLDVTGEQRVVALDAVRLGRIEVELKRLGGDEEN